VTIDCPFINHGLFFQTTTFEIQPCCLQLPLDETVDPDKSFIPQFINNDKISLIKKNFANGVRDKSCKMCWDAEDNGSLSKRQMLLEEFKNYTDLQSTELTHFDLRLSNKCNLKCKMCNSWASSQWESLGQELFEQGIETTFYKEHSKINQTTVNYKIIQEVLENKNIKQITLAGGEPFLMPEVEELIFKLSEQQRYDVKLKLITNVTSAKTKIIKELEKFDTHIIASIDGVEEELEYQRYPAKWKTIENNFIKFYNANVKIAISPAISMLTFLTVDKFIYWCEKFPNAFVNYKEVHEPSYLSFSLIPLDIRQDLHNNLKNYKLKSNMTNWENFISSSMYKYRPITDQERKDLHFYTQTVYDYKTDKKFLEVYPWAAELFH